MSGPWFSNRIPLPFSTEACGFLAVTDAGEGLDLTAVADSAKANVLLVENAGLSTVFFLVGDSNAVAVAPASGTNLDGNATPILPGAIFTFPCPNLSDATLWAICLSGETSTLFVARGWGQ